jgi:hypothetical protein
VHPTIGFFLVPPGLYQIAFYNENGFVILTKPLILVED